jgi:hypothetical protein
LKQKYPLFSKGQKGILIRNYYCSDCHIGPFLQEDIRKNIVIEIGGERQLFYYCRKCYSIKFSTKQLTDLSDNYKERETYILSGKALEDLTKNENKVYYKKEVTISKDPEKIIEPAVEEEEDIPDEKIIEEIMTNDSIKNITEEQPDPLLDDEPIEGLKKEPKEVKNPLNLPDKETVNLETLTGKQIIGLVKEKTGQVITVSLKSKNVIIKHAQKYLGDINKTEPAKITEEVKKPVETLEEVKEPIKEQPVVTPDKNAINLGLLSAKQIIELVKEKTGQVITVSLKSKKVIIKRAQKYLTEKGLL